TNEVNNVAGFLIPGSRVDVLLTLRGDNNSTSARTVLQNVRVLSAGSKTEPDPQGKPENVNVVTLLVTPQESEKLALAQQQGAIQFVLRNGTDSKTSDTPAVDLAQLTGALPKRAVSPELARAGRKHVDDTYTVETIAAGKTTIARFKNSTE